MAARKGDIEHGVGVKFLDERGDHIEPAAVRRHHGAADGEIGVGNGGENVFRLGVYAAARRFDARAVFKADDLRARALRRAEHLLVYAADRAAGDEKPRPPCRGGGLCFPQTRGKLLHMRHSVREVKVESQPVENLIKLRAGNGRGVGAQHFHEMRAGLAQRVSLPRRGAQRIVRDLRAEALFKIFLQPPHLGAPHIARIRKIDALRQMQQKELLAARHQLIHLFLPVARRLADNEIGKVGIRALVAHIEAVARFDERAEIARQIDLRCRDRLGAHAAETHGEHPGGVQNFQWRERAERTGYAPPAFFGGLHLEKARFARVGIGFKCFGKRELHTCVTSFLVIGRACARRAPRRWPRQNAPADA